MQSILFLWQNRFDIIIILLIFMISIYCYSIWEFINNYWNIKVKKKNFIFLNSKSKQEKIIIHQYQNKNYWHNYFNNKDITFFNSILKWSLCRYFIINICSLFIIGFFLIEQIQQVLVTYYTINTDLSLMYIINTYTNDDVLIFICMALVLIIGSIYQIIEYYSYTNNNNKTELEIYGSYEYNFFLQLYIYSVLLILYCASYDLFYFIAVLDISALLLTCLILLKNPITTVSSIFRIESAIKLILPNAIITAIMLYCTSILYYHFGVTNVRILSVLIEEYFKYDMNIGNIDFNYDLNNNIFIDKIKGHNYAIHFGLLGISIGAAAKIGMMPFIIWLEDVFKGTSFTFILFYNLIGKIVSVFFFLSIYISLINKAPQFLNLFFFLIILNMLLSSIFGIWNKSIKGFFVWSGAVSSSMIVGIVAIQILTNNEYYTNIIPTIFIYFFTYILTMLGIIYILNMYKILFINNKYVNLNYINNYNNINTMLKFQEINKIEDLCGSIKKDKVISTLLVIFLTSALGLPPTVLFYTKFSILTFLTNNNYIWYIYLFLLLSALSSFYYIRLIKIIVFDKETKNLLEIKSNPVSNFFLLILLILLLSIMCNSIFIQWIYQFFFFQLKIVSLDIDYYIDFFKFIENNDFNINLNNILINIDNIKQIFIYIFNIYDSISSEYLNKHKIWFSFWIDEEIIKMFKKEK